MCLSASRVCGHTIAPFVNVALMSRCKCAGDARPVRLHVDTSGLSIRELSSRLVCDQALMVCEISIDIVVMRAIGDRDSICTDRFRIDIDKHVLRGAFELQHWREMSVDEKAAHLVAIRVQAAARGMLARKTVLAGLERTHLSMERSLALGMHTLAEMSRELEDMHAQMNTERRRVYHGSY